MGTSPARQGLNLGSQEEWLPWAGRDHGVQWEGSEEEAGVTWVAPIPLVLTGPARWLLTPFDQAQGEFRDWLQ